MTQSEFYAQLAVDMAGVPGVGELSDTDVATAINALAIPGVQTIPSISLLVWVAGRGKLAGIQAAAANSEHPAQNIAIALMAIANRPDAYFDKDDSDHAAMLDGLVATGLFSSQPDTEHDAYPGDKESLVAATVTSTPYVLATYGVAAITEHDVAHVRSL